MALLSLKIPGLILGLLAIIFGILIITMPKLLKWLVGLYFIILGISTIIGAL